MSFQAPPSPSPHDPSLSSPSSPAPAPSPTSTARHYQQQQQQQYQQQQQQIAMMNGMNGTNMAAGMPVPTPAGHQAELNYIYGMVEELSRQLAENRRVTEDIVNGLGRVRNRARAQGVSNSQVIENAADDINGMSPILHSLNHQLTYSRPRTKHRRSRIAPHRISRKGKVQP